jgi:hypothetical protein
LLQIRFFRVRYVDRLRAWMRELHERRDEVLETFEQETVRHEAVYFLETSDGPICVYAIEARDLDQATRAVEENPLPIDLDHRAAMSEALGEEIPAEMVLDELAG